MNCSFHIFDSLSNSPFCDVALVHPNSSNSLNSKIRELIGELSNLRQTRTIHEEKVNIQATRGRHSDERIHHLHAA